MRRLEKNKQGEAIDLIKHYEKLEKNKQGEAIDLIKHYEDTIKTGNKKAIRYDAIQGQMLIKFQDKD